MPNMHLPLWQIWWKVCGEAAFLFVLILVLAGCDASNPQNERAA